MAITYIKFKTPKGNVLAVKEDGKYRVATGSESVKIATGEFSTQNITAKTNKPVDEFNATKITTPLPTLASKESPQPTGTFELPPLPDTDQAVQRITDLGVAMNTAVGLARDQRRDSTLDLLGGIIPTGALPATSFASVIGAFERSSQPLALGLASQALDFASTQEQAKFNAIMQEREQAFNLQLEAKDRLIATQADIRNLALVVGENKGDSAAVSSILSYVDSGDINGAIKAASGYLNAKAGSALTVEELNIPGGGSTLVSFDPADPQGTIKELFRPTSSEGAPTSGGVPLAQTPTDTGGAKFVEPTSFRTEKMNTIKGYVKQTFPDFANQIIAGLTDEQLRLFMEDVMNASIDSSMAPNTFLKIVGFQDFFGAFLSSIGKAPTGGEITNPF